MYSKNRLFATTMIVLLAIGMSFGQSAKLKRGRKYMANLDYVHAIALYNQILEKSDASEAKINLAEAYRKVNDTENAEFWYGQVVRLQDSEPIHKLYYGQMLQRNGKCEMAKEWYDKYIESVPDDMRGQYLDKACDYEEELMTKNADIYIVDHCSFNSSMDDFSPYFYKDGIIFTSERDKGAAIAREHTWTGNPFLELYSVDVNKKGEGEEMNFSYGKSKKFSKDINSKFHDASIAMTMDESEIYVTRNNYINGKKGKSDEGITKLKIFHAQSTGENSWGKLESLPFNSDEYSVAHPALSADGNKLYFASDMPGGFGGMDLYVSEKENGRWGPPVNLGATINTEGHEIFPHFDRSGSGRLYFASDGHIGLGGLDIYYSEQGGNGDWSQPVNLGAPINSNADDFGIALSKDGTYGFFSSDRDGGAGRDDIYSFKKIAVPVEILVFDAETKEPIAGATVVNDCTDETYTTNADGKIFLDMKLEKCCNFTASMETYEDNEQEACTTNITLADKVFVKIPLEKEGKYELEGIVFDQETGLPLEGAGVTLTNDCNDEVPAEFITDVSGKFHFDLKKDCCYKVKGMMTDYLAATVDEICTKDLKHKETLMANLYLQPTKHNGNVAIAEPKGVHLDDTGVYIDDATGLPADGQYPDGRKYENGFLQDGFDRVPGQDLGHDEPIPFLVNIYYDFDKSNIRDEAIPELEKLYAMMTENPSIIVEIGSYTDARGSKRYNKRLSERRAASVVKWLTKKGINRDRLVPKGYGEAGTVNSCKDNVKCTEYEHQLNRRTEFRVIGCTDCPGMESGEIISRPKENPEVDGCKKCPF